MGLQAERLVALIYNGLRFLLSAVFCEAIADLHVNYNSTCSIEDNAKQLSQNARHSASPSADN